MQQVVDKAIEDLQYTLEEDFGSFGRDIVRLGKKVASMKGEMKAVLGLVVVVVIGVLVVGLIVTWQHFSFLFTPCTACASLACRLCCRGLSSCCKCGCRGLASCFKSGSSDIEVQQKDLEAQKKDLEAQIKALEAQKKPEVLDQPQVQNKQKALDQPEAQHQPGDEVK